MKVMVKRLRNEAAEHGCIFPGWSDINQLWWLGLDWRSRLTEPSHKKRGQSPQTELRYWTAGKDVDQMAANASACFELNDTWLNDGSGAGTQLN
jgi:hypothetical protein